MERSKFNEELKVALATQEKRLKQKYKFEVDALRARFKMMHSTGAFFDRSPSTSESEQAAEVRHTPDTFHLIVVVLTFRGLQWESFPG